MIDLQQLTYFTEGNIFTGSATKDPEKGLLLRYRVVPDKEDGALKAWAWTKDLCFERAGETKEMEAPLNTQGLQSIADWLQGLYEAL